MTRKMVDSDIVSKILETNKIKIDDLALKLDVSKSAVYKWSAQKRIPRIAEPSLQDVLNELNEPDGSLGRLIQEEDSVIRKELLKECSIEELVKELGSRSFKVHLEWMGGF